MGLDAVVYCNCFETGLVVLPPGGRDSIRVNPDGSLEPRSRDQATFLAFDRWMQTCCVHTNCFLIQERIGNISMVGWLRDEVLRLATIQNRPVLLTLERVLYSGSHTGDFMALADAMKLKEETQAIAEWVGESSEPEALLRYTRTMIRLINASLQVGKPIAF